MFSVRWLSLAGGMMGERFSDGNVLEGISLFFGGRHSLLRSWLDFMLTSPHVPQLYLRFLNFWTSVSVFLFLLSLTFCFTFLSLFLTFDDLSLVTLISYELSFPIFSLPIQFTLGRSIRAFS